MNTQHEAPELPLGPPIQKGKPEDEGYDDPRHWHPSPNNPGFEVSDDGRLRTCDKPKIAI